MSTITERSIAITLPEATLMGDLCCPAQPRGIVIFVHGSGSSRHSGRNRSVAKSLQLKHFVTLLFDLLTEKEDEVYANRFDIDRLTMRLTQVTAWLRTQPGMSALPLGYFGASTGAAAALRAAAELDSVVRAAVSRGGRPDLAMGSLPRVQAATLLIVGGNDHEVLELNQQAYARLDCIKELAVVPGATHLFEEPGTLEEVAHLAGNWFTRYCATPA